MKRFATIALVALAAACTAATLQAQGHEVRADVPFAFAVGTTVLPTGHYSLTFEPNDPLVIRSTDHRITVLSRTEVGTSPAGNATVLVFDKYGDHYFLREIRCPSIALNAEIPPSKLEKQIRVQMAWRGPDQTLLALK